MKYTLLIILLIAAKWSLAQNDTTSLDKKEVAIAITEEPRPLVDLKKHFIDNNNLTRDELKEVAGTKVFIVLEIDKGGLVSNAFIFKGAESCESCRKKIIEAGKMLLWSPAKSNGYPVERKLTLPIIFK